MEPLFCEPFSITPVGFIETIMSSPVLLYTEVVLMVSALLFGVIATIKYPHRRLTHLFTAVGVSLSALIFLSLLQTTIPTVAVKLFAWQLWHTVYIILAITIVLFIHSFVRNTPNSPRLKATLHLLLVPALLLMPTSLNVSYFDLTQCQGVLSLGLQSYVMTVTLGLLVFLTYTGRNTLLHRTKTDLSRNQLRSIYGLGSISLLILTIFPLISNTLTLSVTKIILFSLVFALICAAACIATKLRRFSLELNTAEVLVVSTAAVAGGLLLAEEIIVPRIITATLIISLTTLTLAFIKQAKNNRQQALMIHSLNERVVYTNRRLSILDKEKSEFISVTSNELRRPLTTIRGHASMLLEGSYGRVSIKAQEPIAKIEESAKDMASALEDYFEISKLESGAMRYNNIDFNLVDEAEHLSDEMRPIAIHKGLTLIFRTEMKGRGVVDADLTKTNQIIKSLVDNAIKYTERGSIKVLVHDDVKRKRIFVDVIDTGIGLDPDSLQTVFEKFERAPNAKTVSTRGQGLGLFKAKQMALAMQGDVMAHSDGEGKGSIFTLELPLAL